MVGALTDLILLDLLGSPRELVLAYGRYSAAIRRPALMAITQAWMNRSQRALQRHLDRATARAVDALIEGLTLHSALATTPMTSLQVHRALSRAVGYPRAPNRPVSR